MDHVADATKKKYEMLAAKKEPDELLPVQKLTKEEKEEGKSSVFDLENINQLTGIAKTWINQDRRYKMWHKTCEDYCLVATDDQINKRFFYKSGIQDVFPSFKHFSRTQLNMMLEKIYMDIIPEIISKYEFKRDFREIKGSTLLPVIETLNHLKYATENAIIRYTHEETNIKKETIKSCIKGSVAKGYITFNLEASKKHKKEILKLDNRIENIDGVWYFNKGAKNV
jgi:hypothetical protein